MSKDMPKIAPESGEGPDEYEKRMLGLRDSLDPQKEIIYKRPLQLACLWIEGMRYINEASENEASEPNSIIVEALDSVQGLLDQFDQDNQSEKRSQLSTPAERAATKIWAGIKKELGLAEGNTPRRVVLESSKHTSLYGLALAAEAMLDNRARNRTRK